MIHDFIHSGQDFFRMLRIKMLSGTFQKPELSGSDGMPVKKGSLIQASVSLKELQDGELLREIQMEEVLVKDGEFLKRPASSHLKIASSIGGNSLSKPERPKIIDVRTGSKAPKGAKGFDR